MSTSGQADQGQVQGMLVKFHPQGDGTTRFDVVCHHSNWRVAHREYFLIPPKGGLHAIAKKGKGKLVRVVYDKTGRERDRPTKIVLVE